MNAVEIEEAISALAEQKFNPIEFPYAFLQAFGNKEATLKRLRSGDTNKSDLGGVLHHGDYRSAQVEPSHHTGESEVCSGNRRQGVSRRRLEYW